MVNISCPLLAEIFNGSLSQVRLLIDAEGVSFLCLLRDSEHCDIVNIWNTQQDW